ncbi:MAG: superoxide dismutase [Bacteroidales bacterium]|nr:superoxide dismutase [Bacteroidales bacterium]
MAFTLPQLPYAFNALEPHIDALTMEIHSQRHHKAYVDNLNKAIDGHADLQKLDIASLLRNIKNVPEGIRQAVINNGGGHANHALFWEIMGPNGGGEPTGVIGDAIKAAFGDFAKMKDTVKANGGSQFGSGWSWVVYNPASGKLEAIKRPNQDSPLMDGLVPVLGVDVWEHAYYLKYQNKRPDYIDAWWNTVNWKAVEEKLAAAKAGK